MKWAGKTKASGLRAPYPSSCALGSSQIDCVRSGSHETLWRCAISQKFWMRREQTEGLLVSALGQLKATTRDVHPKSTDGPGEQQYVRLPARTAQTMCAYDGKGKKARNTAAELQPPSRGLPSPTLPAP